MNKTLLRAVLATCLTLLSGVSTATAASDFFLKIPGLPGESRDNDHQDEIDVLAWDWGMSNPGSTSTGSGGGAGKASFQDLSLTKYIDKATPELMLRVANGTHLPEATLILRRSGESPVEYLKITMKDVIITSLTVGGNIGEDRLTENVSLRFNEFRVEYVAQNPDGSTEPPKAIGWNIALNVGT